MRKLARWGAVLLAVSATATPSHAGIDTSWVRVKKAIADTMTPDQLEAYKVRLATNFAHARLEGLARQLGLETPGDACPAATYEVGTLPYGPVADTTVGAVDDYDLPPDTTAPTCTAPTPCTGAGPGGSLPRGAIYTGTGTGPDRAFKIRTDANCTLTIDMDPTGSEDLSLIVYEAQCSSNLADCVCVDDTGVGGVAEQVTLSAVADTDYFVVIDGYSTGGTPPGPSGPYTLTISGTGCQLVQPIPPPTGGDIQDADALFQRTLSSFDDSPTADFEGVSSTLAQDHLFEHGWWFRASGDTQETEFGLPLTTDYTGNTSVILWDPLPGLPDVAVQEVAQVFDSGVPMLGDKGWVRVDLTITNNGATDLLGFNVFHMMDIDLAGASNDSAVLDEGWVGPYMALSDPSGNIAGYIGVFSDAYLVRPFGATSVRSVLNDAAVTDFDNSGLPFGPADITVGNQWTRDIPAGTSSLITVFLGVNETAYCGFVGLGVFCDGVESGTPDFWDSVNP